MNREDIIRFGEQADEVADRKIKMRGEYHPDWHMVRDEAFAALVAAHEREATISKIESEICHAEINNLRLAPLFGQRQGPLAVRVDSLAAVVDVIRARGEEPKRHPGYIVGDHWLQAAYTRICTGETEDEVMTDYGWQRARGEA